MSLETATYINQLDATNPLGSDPIASGDDHLRLIKATLKATFPNITGAMTKTHTQLNNALDKTGDTMTGPLVLSGDPTVALNAATKQYVDAGDATQSASISSLSSTKADKATTVTAGTGLSGGGDLSANRTLAIANTGVTAGTYGSSSAIPVLTVNAQGQVTSASTVAVPNNSIGVGQTWQSFTSTRAANTSYQNTTGRAICFAVSAASGSRGDLQVSADNSTWVSVGTASDFSSAGSGNSAIVPAGHYYRFTANFYYWSELR